MAALPPVSSARNSQRPPWLFHRKPASRCAAADFTAGLAGSMPVVRNNCIVKSVVFQTGASSRRHEPSGCWRPRISAPSPSCGTRSRSRLSASAWAAVRSRIACQRIAESESSSQSRAPTTRYYLIQAPPFSWRLGRDLRGTLETVGRHKRAQVLKNSISFRFVASLDRKRLGAGGWAEEDLDPRRFR